MGSNLVRVETLALESDIGGMEAEEGDKRSAGDAFRKRALGEKIGAMVASGSVWCQRRWRKH